MIQSKFCISDLRGLFERSIVAEQIAEPLISFDETSDAQTALKFMSRKNLDVIGIRRAGTVVGYGKKEDLQLGNLNQYLREFENTELLSNMSPLVVVLGKLQDLPQVFIMAIKNVSGIITRADLQKAPVRMWLFGLITLLEMQMLALIRGHHCNNSWQNIISEKRIKAAKNIYKDRAHANQEIDLLECLQFIDKTKILVNTKELLEIFYPYSKTSLTSVLNQFERLRNDLAHAREISPDKWPEVIQLSIKLEQFINITEQYCTEEART